MMSMDVSHLLMPETPTPAAIPTVVVPVNQEGVDSGIRVAVERVTVDELRRRQQADAATSAPASLPSQVDVLQAMIVELRQALAGQKQRVAELEQAMDALLRRLRRTPSDPWPADQPALFPDMQAAPAPPPPAPDLPAAAAEPDPANNKTKKKGHGRRSLADLLKTLPLQRYEHPLTEAERLCPCCGRLRQKIGEQTSQQLEYVPAKLVCVQHA
jgi:uncharacterized coiled-coil protein SlyX